MRRAARRKPASSLRLMRQAEALTLAEVAAASGLSWRRLSMVERELSRPHDREIGKILGAIDELARERRVAIEAKP